MTTTALHPAPSLGAVAREQLRAVRAALRAETIVVASLLAFGLAMTAIGAYRATQHPGWHMTIFFDAGATIPLFVFAAFVPMGVWRAEDRARRAYHWSMPVGAHAHTLLKVLAGWAMLMLFALAYILYIYLLRDVAGLITHEWAPHVTRWWEIALAFSGSTIVYLITTAFIVGTGHPWRWALGVFGGWMVLLAIADGAQMQGLRRLVWRLWSGPYGLSVAISGPPRGFAALAAEASYVPLRIEPAHPDVAGWLVSTAVWLAVTLLFVEVAARRHPQS